MTPALFQARLTDQALDLTRTEFAFLHLLLRNPGRVFGRDYLLETVWGGKYETGDRSVDNTILRLRKKLGALGENIETVWGVGYKLRPLK
jgi:DNA-binding response OmpR family regulator